MDLKIPTSFSAPFLGGLEEVRPGIGKTRLGIYYLGKNRNRGFITEEFSALLDKNIPYQPVVGIYSSEKGDFEGHDEDKGKARIYGLIPENPNLSWETRVDKDGVERTYRTADVYLYTGRLKIANSIPGHPQSMELDPDTLQGDWQLIDGEPYYVYKKGNYIGFSVLGKNVEPCFEGSHFYNKDKDEKENFFNLLTQFSYFMENGGKIMNENTAVSENENLELETPTTSEAALESEVTEDNETPEVPETLEVPETTTEENVIVEEKSESEVDPKDDENIEVSFTLVGEELEVYNDLITKFESLNQISVKFSEMENEISTLNSKIVEFETENNTLKSEAVQNKAAFDNLNADYLAVKQVVSDMEHQKKEALCEKYSKVVSPEAMENLKQKMDEYSVEDFEKELSYAGRESLFNPLNSAPASYGYSNANDSHLKKLLEAAKKQNCN